jgi:tetratricopeptide (TPR) repeat protein
MRDLKTDMETLRAVLAHAQNRDFQSAGDLAAKTLASGFEHPMLLNVLATRYEEQGRFEDSLQLLERAVAIAPGDVGARNALALCLQRLDRPADSLVHIEELLKRQPDLGFAHANKGNALIALGSLARAKESHLRALELDPGNLAATAALAAIATQRGAHDEARTWAEQALKTAPGLPDAVLSLAAAELASGATAKAESLLHRLIVDSRAGQIDRARATGLLGDVLDAQGRYAEAFDAYTTSNEALRQVHFRFAAGTGMLAYTRALAAAMAATGEQDWVQRVDPNAPAAAVVTGEAATHVFLVGFPRSGTTLLEVLLDGHPQVVSSEENEFLTEGVLRFMREPLDLSKLAHADETELNALRERYWQQVRETGVQATGKVFVDKHPLHTLKLPLIARLFPRARILFACRDPREVVLSCFRRRFKMNPAMYELLTLPGTAAFYDAVMSFAEQVRPLLGLDWHVVRYETLVADLAGQTRTICAFLGIEEVPGMGDFAQRVSSREHATPSTAQLARGLVASGIDQWRRYEAQLAPVLALLEPWVRRLGYGQTAG